MKFLDKIKDLFTDEINDDSEEFLEEKEEKIEKIEKKSNKLPKVMRGDDQHDEKIIEKNISDVDLFKDFENIQLDNVNVNTNTTTNNNFRFPISFEENDLLDDKILSNQNVMHREKEIEKVVIPSKEPYSLNQNSEKKVSLFKASPVISPVYGILDKNYKKEEVQSKKKPSKDINRNSVKVDFESVRKKAYGSLVDDIKDNLSSKKEVEKNNEIEDNIYSLDQNINEITLGDIENNFEDFGIVIDDYKKSSNNSDIKIVSFEENDNKKDIIEIKSPVINTEKQADDFIEDNNNDIFNLIDNMYQNQEEEKND